jgi:hypothetical protein
MTIKNRILVSRPRPPVLIVVCTVISALVLPNLVQAQNWAFEPIVRVGGEYDDNAVLDIRTDQEVEVTGFLLDLAVDIKYSSPTTEFVLQPHAVSRNYPDEPDFDSDDFFLESRFSHRGQSNTFGFRTRYEDQSIRTGERIFSDLEIEDPDEIPDDDTGRVLVSGKRSKWLAVPSWDYQLSNTSSIGAVLVYNDVQYEEVLEEFLNDYTDAQLSLNYRRKFSNVNTGLLSMTARRYDSAGSEFDITGYGVRAGIQHALSQKTQLRATIGLEEFEQADFKFDSEIVGAITLTRSLETIRMFAQYRRTVSGSGANGVAARDSYNFNFRRRLSEKISAGLGVRAYRSRGVGGTTSIDDRNYVQLHSNIRWYLSTSFVIEADYRYTINDRSATIIGERANSNQINLWLVYQPKTIPEI